MGMSLFFRESGQQNYFRNIISNILKCDEIDTIIMVYPYFAEKEKSEYFKHSTFKTIIEFNLNKRKTPLNLFTISNYNLQYSDQEHLENYINFTNHIKKFSLSHSDKLKNYESFLFSNPLYYNDQLLSAQFPKNLLTVQLNDSLSIEKTLTNHIKFSYYLLHILLIFNNIKNNLYVLLNKAYKCPTISDKIYSIINLLTLNEILYYIESSDYSDIEETKSNFSSFFNEIKKQISTIFEGIKVHMRELKKEIKELKNAQNSLPYVDEKLYNKHHKDFQEKINVINNYLENLNKPFEILQQNIDNINQLKNFFNNILTFLESNPNFLSELDIIHRICYSIIDTNLYLADKCDDLQNFFTTSKAFGSLHAKLLMGFKNNQLALAVFGSSNFTNMALQQKTNTDAKGNYYYNHELDTFIWNNDIIDPALAKNIINIEVKKLPHNIFYSECYDNNDIKNKLYYLFINFYLSLIIYCYKI